MIRVFIGHDNRFPIATRVCEDSLRRRCSQPVAVTWLDVNHFPNMARDNKGTEFQRLRFLVPWLCGYEGHALYLDQDTLVLDDMTAMRGRSTFKTLEYYPNGEPPAPIVHCVHHENAQRKCRSSVMWLNCAALRSWTPALVRNASDDLLFDFGILEKLSVGTLDPRWNVLDHVTDDMGILHLTSGGPWHGVGRTKDPKAEALWRKEASCLRYS